MRSAPAGTKFADANYPWTVLAENIEDMQIAIILSNGTVCTSQDNPTPSGCDMTKAVAVRVTLVGRSSSPIAGATPTMKGGYEDEPTIAPTAPDSLYLRRAMTATITLRNFHGS